MLQSLAESMSGFSLGRRSPKAAGGTCVHSLRSSLWSRRRMRMTGRRLSHFQGRGNGGGGKETVSVDIWLRKWKQASICLQNLHFSSTKFSFQSPDHKRRVSACVRACVYVGVFSTNRSTEINISTNASHRASFCASLSASLGTHCSGCLAQGHNFKIETCLLVCWIFVKSCLSACRRSTDNNLGTFFYSLFKLRLVCLNQKQILK